MGAYQEPRAWAALDGIPWHVPERGHNHARRSEKQGMHRTSGAAAQDYAGVVVMLMAQPVGTLGRHLQWLTCTCCCSWLPPPARQRDSL